MKLKNIFKKSGKKVVKQTAQTLDKKQLAKVVGGVESDYNQGGKAHYGSSSSGLV